MRKCFCRPTLTQIVKQRPREKAEWLNEWIKWRSSRADKTNWWVGE
jgi:hypothetical protein